jgi:hypothetical protein
MKFIKLLILACFTMVSFCKAQQAPDIKEINTLITTYSQSVKERDSLKFYQLFNEGPVTWCAALKDGSQAAEVKKNGADKAGSNYFAGSYKGFMRGLFSFKSTEDKFDNIQIVGDGTVASVMMDYSFWGNGKMTNWGNKYLALIKRDGKWKITSVIYSLELIDYMQQPSLHQRKALRVESRER